MMPDLRKYTPGRILEAMARLQDAFAPGGDPSLRRIDLTFRDEDGTYWYLDVQNKRWYRHASAPGTMDESAWQTAETPARDLEGPDSLSAHIPAPIKQPAPVDDPQAENPLLNAPASRVLAHIVGYIRDSYQEGRITADDAERYLTGQYLVDKAGRFWIPGLHSEKWYSFENGRWSVAENPPPEEELLRLDRNPATCDACGQTVEKGWTCPDCGTDLSPQLSGAEDETYAGIMDFMLFGRGSLPEPVTEPWQPPPDVPRAMPQRAFRCASCGAANPPGSRFCNQCAAVLAEVVNGGAFGSTPSTENQGPACPTCGAHFRPGHQFCVQCGTPMPKQATADTQGPAAVPSPCPDCGVPNPPGSRFCAQCGRPLSKPR